jgi:chromosome segregation ATPase
MLPPESEPGTGDSELSESVIRNLRDQVTQLDAVLKKCQERLAMFENAAVERLHVIEKGDALLRGQAETVAAMQQEISQLRLELKEGAEERAKLERACQEAGRGMVELANRERALTGQILELRNEGLLHSIIRRIRSLLS